MSSDQNLDSGGEDEAFQDDLGIRLTDIELKGDDVFPQRAPPKSNPKTLNKYRSTFWKTNLRSFHFIYQKFTEKRQPKM